MQHLDREQILYCRSDWQAVRCLTRFCHRNLQNSCFGNICRKSLFTFQDFLNCTAQHECDFFFSFQADSCSQKFCGHLVNCTIRCIIDTMFNSVEPSLYPNCFQGPPCDLLIDTTTTSYETEYDTETSIEIQTSSADPSGDTGFPTQTGISDSESQLLATDSNDAVSETLPLFKVSGCIDRTAHHSCNYPGLDCSWYISGVLPGEKEEEENRRK